LAAFSEAGVGGSDDLGLKELPQPASSVMAKARNGSHTTVGLFILNPSYNFRQTP
jgi:hypothetical protein